MQRQWWPHHVAEIAFFSWHFTFAVGFWTLLALWLRSRTYFPSVLGCRVVARASSDLWSPVTEFCLWACAVRTPLSPCPIHHIWRKKGGGFEGLVDSSTIYAPLESPMDHDLTEITGSCKSCCYLSWIIRHYTFECLKLKKQKNILWKLFTFGKKLTVWYSWRRVRVNITLNLSRTKLWRMCTIKDKAKSGANVMKSNRFKCYLKAKFASSTLMFLSLIWEEKKLFQTCFINRTSFSCSTRRKKASKTVWLKINTFNMPGEV